MVVAEQEAAIPPGPDEGGVGREGAASGTGGAPLEVGASGGEAGVAAGDQAPPEDAGANAGGGARGTRQTCLPAGLPIVVWPAWLDLGADNGDLTSPSIKIIESVWWYIFARVEGGLLRALWGVPLGIAASSDCTYKFAKRAAEDARKGEAKGKCIDLVAGEGDSASLDQSE